MANPADSKAIRIKDPIAHRLCIAGYSLARQAIEMEEMHPWSGQEWGKETAENNRVQEFTIASIVMNIACVEGIINELFANASDDLSHAVSGYGGVSAPHIRTAWANWWEENRLDRRNTIMDKVQAALWLADIEELPTDRGPVQEFGVLQRLRNALVHSYPQYQPLAGTVPKNELSLLEQELTNRFEPCSMVHPKSAFIWKGCLGAGCARWAVETQINFENKFFHSLGINRTAESNL